MEKIFKCYGPEMCGLGASPEMQVTEYEAALEEINQQIFHEGDVNCRSLSIWDIRISSVDLMFMIMKNYLDAGWSDIWYAPDYDSNSGEFCGVDFIFCKSAAASNVIKERIEQNETFFWYKYHKEN
jgi:hypothetical protein